MKRSCRERSRYGFENVRVMDWTVSVVSLVVVEPVLLCCDSLRAIVSTAWCAFAIASLIASFAASSACFATPSAALTIAPPTPGAMMLATTSQKEP